jgi:hypothetical protein
MMRIILSALLTISTIAAFGQDKTIPTSIQVDNNSKLIMQAYAKGVQVYVCQRDLKDSAQYVWAFKEPRATLYTDSTYHQVIGKHYFDSSKNPTWENIDGSKVTAVKLQQVSSPNNLAITWLLLKATITQGTGILKSAQFVQRVFTKGGKAPAKAASDQLGKTIEVPYTAEYLFYSEK